MKFKSIILSTCKLLLISSFLCNVSQAEDLTCLDVYQHTAIAPIPTCKVDDKNRVIKDSTICEIDYDRYDTVRKSVSQRWQVIHLLKEIALLKSDINAEARHFDMLHAYINDRLIQRLAIAKAELVSRADVLTVLSDMNQSRAFCAKRLKTLGYIYNQVDQVIGDKIVEGQFD